MSDPVEFEAGAATYSVSLPQFEGPLDLLLHLCQKHELDILDIPIGFITKKYLEYLSVMQLIHLDVAAEYLVMAATLAHIKSKMLLPLPPPGQEDDIAAEEEEDPREALIRRLLEYQKYKLAAAELEAKGIAAQNVFLRGSTLPEEEEQGLPPLAQIPLFRLIEAFQGVLAKSKIKITHDIVADRISITDRIHELAAVLEVRRRMMFEELFEGLTSKFDLVITFLALLEMSKLRMTRLYQSDSDPTSPLYVEYTAASGDHFDGLEGRSIADAPQPQSKAAPAEAAFVPPEDGLATSSLVDEESDVSEPASSFESFELREDQDEDDLALDESDVGPLEAVAEEALEPSNPEPFVATPTESASRLEDLGDLAPDSGVEHAAPETPDSELDSPIAKTSDDSMLERELTAELAPEEEVDGELAAASAPEDTPSSTKLEPSENAAPPQGTPGPTDDPSREGDVPVETAPASEALDHAPGASSESVSLEAEVTPSSDPFESAELEAKDDLDASSEYAPEPPLENAHESEPLEPSAASEPPAEVPQAAEVALEAPSPHEQPIETAQEIESDLAARSVEASSEPTAEHSLAADPTTESAHESETAHGAEHIEPSATSEPLAEASHALAPETPHEIETAHESEPIEPSAEVENEPTAEPSHAPEHEAAFPSGESHAISEAERIVADLAFEPETAPLAPLTSEEGTGAHEVTADVGSERSREDELGEQPFTELDPMVEAASANRLDSSLDPDEQAPEQERHAPPAPADAHEILSQEGTLDSHASRAPADLVAMDDSSDFPPAPPAPPSMPEATEAPPSPPEPHEFNADADPSSHGAEPTKREPSP